MYRFEAIEFLKLRFGVLFLSNYDLPSLDDVKLLLDTNGVNYCFFYPFLTMNCVLRELMTQVMERRNDILHLSKNNFLGKFSDRKESYVNITFPEDVYTSALQFFQKFFDDDYRPASQGDLAEIVEWILFVVQFSESNEERSTEALDFLTEINSYLYSNCNRDDCDSY